MNIRLGGGEMEEKEGLKKNKLNKKVIIIISSIVAIILATSIGIYTYMYTTVSKYDEKVMPGVFVEGIDMSGKSIDDVTFELNEKYTNKLKERTITITAGDKQYTIPYEQLNVKFNIDETVKAAFDHNKELGTIQKYKALKNPEKKDFAISFEYNNEAISSMVSAMAEEINQAPVDATIRKSGSNFEVTDHVVGKELDVQALLDEINNKVKDSKEGNIDVTGTINEEVPNKTKEKLATVSTLVASASTTFGTNDASRATNIAIGAQTLNGILLMPGESFSFNTVVGDTTPDKGYQEGGVYVGDKLEKGYGGGICQVSSTLHNAVLRAGILPDQRTNHSMTVGYVPLGLDATIAYGYLDYVFTNPYDYPIYLEGYAYNGKLTFNIYSDPSVNAGKTYEFSSEIYETIPLTVKYEDDPTLEKGKEVVKLNGSNGYKVKAYRITYTNGVETNRELLNNDTYTPLATIIRRGTKEVPKTN